MKAAKSTVSVEDAVTMSKREQADAIVERYRNASFAAGIIPVSVLDLAAITSLQVKMLQEISAVYGVKFSKAIVKSSILSLIGGLGATALGIGAISLVKAIPVAGPYLTGFTMPTVATAFTNAVGAVFVSHFEAGGTLETFKPLNVKTYFRKKFAEGAKAAVVPA